MRALVCLSYVLLMLLYFFLDYSKVTGALFLIGQTSFIAYLCHQLANYTVNEIEKTLLTYIEYISLANVAYIIVCYIRGTDFAIYNTDIFAYILGITTVVISVHIAYLAKK